MRRAGIGDEPVLRELRLEAMLDSPEAFGSNYEREFARTTDDWRRWLAPGATFILEADGVPRGIVAGMHDKEDAEVVHLMAMWVNPALRGSGAAERLVAAVVAWGRTEGARCVRLDVFETNERARRVYERCGFVPTGLETTHDLDGRVEVRMEMPA